MVDEKQVEGGWEIGEERNSRMKAAHMKVEACGRPEREGAFKGWQRDEADDVWIYGCVEKVLWVTQC